MHNFSFGAVDTIAIATVFLLIGNILRKRISLLERFCIPAHVVGGLLFSLIALYGYVNGKYKFEFHYLVQMLCMTVCFTAVGFSCNLRAAQNYGARGSRLALVIALVVICQDVLGIVLAKLFGINPLIGLSTASVAMVGGHGTAGAFAPIFEQMGAQGALTVGLSAATFGLVAGGLIGGPVAKYIYDRHHANYRFEMVDADMPEENSTEICCNDTKPVLLHPEYLYSAVLQIIVAVGIGDTLARFFTELGWTFPPYMGGLIVGMIIRNISVFTGLYDVHIDEVNAIGGLGLGLFVTLALMTLKLWELAGLAIPLIVMLFAQVVLMALLAIFVAFRVLGGDYDANVMAGGVCGFALGAMPNALSNMQTFTKKYAASPTAMLVLPSIGAVSIDIINGIVIILLMNLLK